MLNGILRDTNLKVIYFDEAAEPRLEPLRRSWSVSAVDDMAFKSGSKLKLEIVRSASMSDFEFKAWCLEHDFVPAPPNCILLLI